jgi:hypothetical protein
MEVDTQQVLSTEQPAQPHVTNLQLSILATIKTAQLQNGLKHGDYSRYRWVETTSPTQLCHTEPGNAARGLHQLENLHSLQQLVGSPQQLSCSAGLNRALEPLCHKATPYYHSKRQKSA